MSQIEHVHARQILDSRGNPTVEVELSVRVRRLGPRRGAVRRLDRRVRGHRAARRRLGLDGQGRHAGGRQRQRRDRHRGPRPGRLEPGGARPDADHPRRHPEQVAARRQRDPRGVARGRARVGGRGAAAAVALPRRRDRARPAGADDERAQRRRPRRQQRRLPGVHDRAGRRALVLARRCGWARRSSTTSRRRCTSGACRPRSATRAALRPTSTPTRRRSRC